LQISRVGCANRLGKKEKRKKKKEKRKKWKKYGTDAQWEFDPCVR